MTLSHLLPLFQDIPLPEVSRVDGARSWTTDTLPAAARAVALAALSHRAPGPILVVAAREETVDALTANLSQLLPAGDAPMVWHAADPLPYEQMPHDPGLAARRSTVLGRLTAGRDTGRARIVVSTARALMTAIRRPESFARDIVDLKLGQRIDDAALVRRLSAAGYEHQPQVDGPGTMSRRGGILDIFSPGAADAVRIELFGDEIDSIRRFDPLTQRSTERIERVTLLPPIEFDLADRVLALERIGGLDLAGLRDEVRAEWERLVGLLEAGAIPPSIDLVASRFPANDASLLDYLPVSATLVVVDPRSVTLQMDQIALQAEDVRATLEQAGEIPTGFPIPYRRRQDLAAGMERLGVWRIGSDHEPGIETPTGAPFGDTPIFGGRIDDLVESVRGELADGWRVVLATEQSERLRDVLEEHDIYPRAFKRGAADAATPPAPGSIDVVHAPLTVGFRLAPARLLVLSDLELFGIRKLVRAQGMPTRQRPRRARQFNPGSYVVHVEHGVGQFAGLVRLDLSGVEREYLQVDYAGSDRLYVPVDQSDRLVSYESPAG